MAQTREPEPYGSPLWSYLAFILVAFVVLYLVVKGIRK